MKFLKLLFNEKEKPITSYVGFWEWFSKNEAKLFKVLKNNENVQKDFLDKVMPKLKEINHGYWLLAGMFDDNTAEIIITADGVIKNIVFVEELVAASPKIKNWKITALKQPSEINNFGIEMGGFKFGKDTMNFYATEHKEMPDEIDITIIHNDFNEENRTTIGNGIFLTLDNTLGELNSVSSIDNVDFLATKDATKELIPIEKLKDFLIWREKEFVEKYKGLRHNTENDSYSSLEATLKNGKPLFALVNTDLLNWDSKASHPWIAILEIKYDGENNNGMPENKIHQRLNEIEDKIMLDLKDGDGYLNIGRETADSVREIYFACVDFRKPSKVLNAIVMDNNENLEISFDIYKDKYWRSFNRFMP